MSIKKKSNVRMHFTLENSEKRKFKKRSISTNEASQHSNIPTKFIKSNSESSSQKSGY